MFKNSCCLLDSNYDLLEEYLIIPKIKQNGKLVFVFNFLLFGNLQKKADLPFLICFAYFNIAC